MTTTVLIIGASSAIAQATARLYATQGAQLFLLGRDADKLDIIAADLRVRGAAQVNYSAGNLLDLQQQALLLQQAITQLGKIDIALLAYGMLPNQIICQNDMAELQHALAINFSSATNFISLLANHLEQQQQGCLAILTSVAGDRGRKNSYVYCAAKAGLSTFLAGLNHRLASANVHVLDIKPGPVVSPMTQHLRKNFLWTTPDYVAKKIILAINKKRHCVYIPGYWRIIMCLIRAIPNKIYGKLAAHNELL